MQIQQNMAAVIRVVKDARGESLAEFSAELEISRSSLQDYLSGHGNPNISTVEHLADKLGVDPIFLLTGILPGDEMDSLLRMINQLGYLSRLGTDNRILFVEKLLELVHIWNEGDASG